MKPGSPIRRALDTIIQGVQGNFDHISGQMRGLSRAVNEQAEAIEKAGAGIAGATGLTGPCGAVGESGGSGACGAQGEPGPCGSDGPCGPQGEVGGFGGNSVAEWWVNNWDELSADWYGWVGINTTDTYDTITTLYLAAGDENAVEVGAWVETFDDSTSPNKGYLLIEDLLYPRSYIIYAVTGTVTRVEDGDDYYLIPVTFVVGSGTLPFAEDCSVYISFSRTGDYGPCGALGPCGASGPAGPCGASGACGSAGPAFADLDGGESDSNYGGVDPIDADEGA